jgi:hypothetical protein
MDGLSLATAVPRRHAFEINDLALLRVESTSRQFKSF